MLFPRSTEREIMDDASIRDERLDDALRELTIINRWLGGRSTSRRGIQQCLQRILRPPVLSVLDVGAGGSDLLSAISSFHSNLRVTSLDLNLRACEYSMEVQPAVTAVNGSVLSLPIKERSFDLVHASLFLHHLSERELPSALHSLYSVARHGVIINELRRSIVAYLGIALLTRLFSRSAMIRHDAPVSVRRGFTRNEIKQFCALLPSSAVIISRRWAFRWLVCIVKNNE